MTIKKGQRRGQATHMRDIDQYSTKKGKEND